MIAVIAGLAVGWVVTLFAYERFVRSLRTELNQARAQEQVLLNRLANRAPWPSGPLSRTAEPAPMLDVQEVEDGRVYLSDPTGLITVELEPEEVD